MKAFLADRDFTLYLGDVREVLRDLPDASVDCCATSPPFYGLRDYGADGQIGLEATLEEWAAELVGVFREVRRVLRDDGTLWVECGDSYGVRGGVRGGGAPGDRVASDGYVRRNRDERRRTIVSGGIKPKDLIGQPWLLAFALRTDGWYLRQAIVWHKPNAMPESVTDRCTTAHSYVFLLSKSARYFFDADAISEPAEWARWGDQTTPKYDGDAAKGTAGSWIKPRTRDDLQQLARNAQDAGELRRGFRSEDDRASIYVGREGKNERIGDGTDSRRRRRRLEGMNARYDARAAEGVYDHGTRNPRSVWTIPTRGYEGAHFATWPERLVERILFAGCPEGGTVLDPFMGSGTTALVARKLGRRSIGVELNEKYAATAAARLSQLSLLAEAANG